MTDQSTTSKEYPEEKLKRRSPHRKHFYSWTATDREQLRAAEKILLSGLRYYQATVAGLNTISTDDITCMSDDCTPSLLSSETLAATSQRSISARAANTHSDERDIVVLVHGFAGGVATFAQNWGYLAERYHVYAMDLPGFARSERSENASPQSVADAMDFMVGYLHRWFERMQFTRKVIILAHSFGSFLSAHFAMRYGPQYVKALVLTEPWGVNRANPDRLKSMPFAVRVLLKLFYNCSPLAVLRGLGPAGPYMFRRTRPDFAQKWTEYLDDPVLLYDYLYHCNALSPAVGEKMFRACCHADVASKEPLVDALPFHLSKDIPVGFLFGDQSWLSPTETLEMAAQMSSMGFRVGIDSVATAGHQLFMDDANQFNAQVSALMDAITDAEYEITIDLRDAATC